MHEKTLPIGSVVLLKNGNKRLMITGYYQYNGDDRSKIYDYVGVAFPEGFMRADALAMFDHDQIEAVYSIGHKDENWYAFESRLKAAIEASDKENGRQ